MSLSDAEAPSSPAIPGDQAIQENYFFKNLANATVTVQSEEFTVHKFSKPLSIHDFINSMNARFPNADFNLRINEVRNFEATSKIRLVYTESNNYTLILSPVVKNVWL